MRDVLVLCEGHTEREFCNRTLQAHFAPQGVSLSGTLYGRPSGGRQGGIQSWDNYRRELIKLSNGRDGRTVGLLVDYYRLPEDWPGRIESLSRPVQERGLWVENRIREDLQAEIGDRLVPCVQLHEFESLVFVDAELAALSLGILADWSDQSSRRIRDHLQQVRDEHDSVESINDSFETAPSRRLQQIVPGYNKRFWGPAIVADIGLDQMRQGCPWLDRWLNSIEALGDE